MRALTPAELAWVNDPMVSVQSRQTRLQQMKMKLVRTGGIGPLSWTRPSPDLC